MNTSVGNALWTMLHAYAMAYPMEADEERQYDARFWLSVFGKLVEEKSSGCPCRQEWENMLRIMPPPLHSGEEFHLWTLAAHDRVNRKLNKPLHHKQLTLKHPLLLAS
jgi:hypothetical protein